MIDCLEFDRALRQTDAAGEIGFLAMDLSYRGHDDLSERLLRRYADAADDYELYWVVDFYQSQRAVVWAKVAKIASADSALGWGQRHAAEQSAKRHLAFAEKILRTRSCGSVTLLCGKVGTGKSTAADFLANLCGGIVVSSDHLRKKLAGLPPSARVTAVTDVGLYSPNSGRRSTKRCWNARLRSWHPAVWLSWMRVSTRWFDAIGYAVGQAREMCPCC
jgi:hypothetical protein